MLVSLLKRAGALGPRAVLTRAYRYTLNNNNLLTSDQRDFYEENGYLVVRDLVSANKLEACSKRFRQICNGEISKKGITVTRDVSLAKTKPGPGEQHVARIQDLHHDEVLFGFCKLPEVLKYVECFTGANIYCMHTILVNKPPDLGTKSSRHPMHQDTVYMPYRPVDSVVGVWMALEKVTRENGCLAVVPGTHKGELQEHAYPDWEGGVNTGSFGLVNYKPDTDRVHVEMEAGDALFFHPLLVHGAGMNRSSGYRKSTICHYAASECHYFDVTGEIQQVVEDATKVIYARLEKRAGGTGERAARMKLQDHIKNVSRHVQGVPGKLNG